MFLIPQDNCSFVANSNQRNMVHPMTFAGDHCENPDSDAWVDLTDNCPDTFQDDQANTDGDEYGDACEQPNCVSVINHWTVGPGDTGCDGYADTTTFAPRAAESVIGTMVATKCSTTPAGFDEPLPDAWPPDFNDNQLVNG